MKNTSHLHFQGKGLKPIFDFGYEKFRNNFFPTKVYKIGPNRIDLKKQIIF